MRKDNRLQEFGVYGSLRGILPKEAALQQHRFQVQPQNIEDAHLQHIIHRYHIVSVPTLMFFRRGEVLWRESGAVSYHHLVTILEELEEYELAGQR